MARTDLWQEGYRWGAPTEEAEEIDASIARRFRCPKCGGEVHYDGWTNERTGSYIAMMVCTQCGWKREF